MCWVITIKIYAALFQKSLILNTILKYRIIMADPSSYVSAKLASMIGGFLGGSAILTFIRPKTIGEAFMRGGTSVGSAMIFSTPLLNAFGWPTDWETQLMAGFCIGFISYSVLGMVANYLFIKRNSNIVDVVSDIKDAVTVNRDKSNTDNKSEK